MDYSQLKFNYKKVTIDPVSGESIVEFEIVNQSYDKIQQLKIAVECLDSNSEVLKTVFFLFSDLSILPQAAYYPDRRLILKDISKFNDFRIYVENAKSEQITEKTDVVKNNEKIIKKSKKVIIILPILLTIFTIISIIFINENKMHMANEIIKGNKLTNRSNDIKNYNEWTLDGIDFNTDYDDDLDVKLNQKIDNLKKVNEKEETYYNMASYFIVSIYDFINNNNNNLPFLEASTELSDELRYIENLKNEWPSKVIVKSQNCSQLYENGYDYFIMISQTTEDLTGLSYRNDFIISFNYMVSDTIKSVVSFRDSILFDVNISTENIIKSVGIKTTIETTIEAKEDNISSYVSPELKKAIELLDREVDLGSPEGLNIAGLELYERGIIDYASILFLQGTSLYSDSGLDNITLDNIAMCNYNLACSLSLLYGRDEYSDLESIIIYLKNSFILREDRIKRSIEDHDFDAIRDSYEFKNLLFEFGYTL